MMIGMSGLGVWMGFGVLLIMHAISGWEGAVMVQGVVLGVRTRD